MTAPATPASLREVQRWIASRVRPGARSGAPAAIALNPQREVPGEERLAVYAGGYLARMREALAEVYEATAHILGQAAFAVLAAGYAARHPSHDYNLSRAGRHLPAFLRDWPKTAELPFLPDLARLEWHIAEAFHAFDESPLDPAALQAVPPTAWDTLIFRFQPSVGLVVSAWPVLDLWAARTQPRDQVNVDVDGRPQAVLVSRQGQQTRCELVDDAERAALIGLLAGESLGAVCATLAAREGHPPPVHAWCARWMRQGLLAACGVAPAAA